jgi:hypothetical protein
MRAILFMLLAAGCSDPYQEAKDANSIEAYEAYLKENPTSARAFEAQMSLENLYIDRARQSGDLSHFDEYLDRFKDKSVSKKTYDNFVKERKETAWKTAISTHTAEAYEVFIKDYDKKDPRKVRLAKQYLKVSQYEPKLKLGPIEQEQINMAKDKDGPLNGWSFSAEVTNSGDKELEWLQVRVNFLDADGKTLDADEQSMDTTIVGLLPGREWATPESRKPPFKPGQTRNWEYTTGDIPADWSKRVRIDFIKLRFVGDDD